MNVSFAGADPRVALRERAELTEEDRAAIDRRLDRLDAARGAPWTREVLALIAARPGVRAPDLAAGLGRRPRPEARAERARREGDGVRLLAVGYEISPRGRAYLG